MKTEEEEKKIIHNQPNNTTNLYYTLTHASMSSRTRIIFQCLKKKTSLKYTSTSMKRVKYRL